MISRSNLQGISGHSFNSQHGFGLVLAKMVYRFHLVCLISDLSIPNEPPHTHSGGGELAKSSVLRPWLLPFLVCLLYRYRSEEREKLLLCFCPYTYSFHLVNWSCICEPLQCGGLESGYQKFSLIQLGAVREMALEICN
jgi:hypothetical protein